MNVEEDIKEDYRKEVLKYLILLCAFEKNFVQLIEPHIKEEYDFNEYYLINKNWMNNYKQVNNFDKICKKLE